MIKGMIFAAGLGTRLRPLTDRIPKAMVEVGGTPMLRRVIDRMGAAGVSEIVVNVHHLPDVITDYIGRVKDDLGTSIIISDERDRILDTGGGLLGAASLLADADAVVLHNADILSDIPLAPMIDRHMASRASATLLVDPRRESSRRLLFDRDSRLHGRVNLTTGATTPEDLDISGLIPEAFGGIHVVSPAIFEPLADFAARRGPVFSITDFYCEAASRLPIMPYEAPQGARWYDVGRPESLASARVSFA